MNKFILKSKTIWGAILAAIPALQPFLTMAGVELPEGLVEELDTLVLGALDWLEAGAGVVGMALVVWGRLGARTRLTIT